MPWRKENVSVIETNGCPTEIMEEDGISVGFVIFINTSRICFIHLIINSGKLMLGFIW